MANPFRVDPRPRIDFYVQHGLVRRAPSDSQLAEAARRNASFAGPMERIRYYLRDPKQLLPKGKPRLQSNDEIERDGLSKAPPPPSSPAPVTYPVERIDRLLVHAFDFSPLRFGVQTLFNPWNAVAATGLEIPTRYLISHLLHTPHPTALWDLQILHPDPGGLDELERQVRIVQSRRGVRARLFHAMAPREGYYDHLLRRIERVRRFDYPPTPVGMVATYDNLVVYLNAAAELPG